LATLQYQLKQKEAEAQVPLAPNVAQLFLEKEK
jgi:hypothetical protein